MTLRLSFCREVKMPHYFCELKQLIQLACSDKCLNNMVMNFAAGLLGGVPLAGILYSYYKIVASIHGISSAQGKYKAFSTCASHLSGVSLFFSTSLGIYLSSSATHSSYLIEINSVMYTVVTPMLNPFIYSLRNKHIKRALKAFFHMAAIRSPVDLGWRRAHDWRVQSLVPYTANLWPDFGIWIWASIYFLGFSFLWHLLLDIIYGTHLISLMIFSYASVFPFNRFPTLTFILSLGSEK